MARGLGWGAEMATLPADPDAARALMREFVGAVEGNTSRNGGPYCTVEGISVPTSIDERVIRHFAASFKAILEGEKPAIALCLTSGEKHRPTSARIEDRNKKFASQVEHLLLRGTVQKAAYIDVMEQYNKSPEAKENAESVSADTVKAAHLEHRELGRVVAQVLAGLGGN